MGGDSFQRILSKEQRRQLIALSLLVADEPTILYQLQQGAQLSRTTILKDLDVIAEWLKSTGLELDRRPNYGFEVTGSEQLKRQALAALLWGQTPLGEPLTNISYANGLTFDMGADTGLLPIVEKAGKAIHKWDIKRAFTLAALKKNGRGLQTHGRIVKKVGFIDASRIN